MKLLIVDDSSVIRRRIERTLAHNDIAGVITARNGEEAIEVFNRERPELVTMDLTMPELDGVECIRRLVEIEPDVTILVISALKDKPTAIKAMKNGAVGFLCKPFDEESLNGALARLIDKRGAAS